LGPLSVRVRKKRGRGVNQKLGVEPCHLEAGRRRSGTANATMSSQSNGDYQTLGWRKDGIIWGGRWR